jgi:hypothetical protein
MGLVGYSPSVVGMVPAAKTSANNPLNGGETGFLDNHTN